MKIRQFKNDNGITLVELLAAIGLLTIVIGISSTLIIQVINGNQGASKQISLSQNSNILINELRDQYIEKSKGIDKGSNLNLCLHETTDITVTNIVIDGEEKSIDSGCIKNIIKQDSLPIKITTENDLGQKLTLETTWMIKDRYEVPIIVISEDKDIENDEKDYSDGDTKDKCDFYGNTRFTQTQIGSWNSCLNPTVHEGNAWFMNNISVFANIHFTIDRHLFTDKIFNLEQSADLYVKDSVNLGGRSTLKSNSTMRVDGSLVATDDITIQENTNVNIGKFARFDSNLKMMGNANLNIGGNFSIKEALNLQENNYLSVSKDADFQEEVKLMSNAQLIIKGDAYFNSSLHFQQNSKITIYGDAHVKGKVSPEWGAGKMCIIGEASFDKALYSNLKIYENASECFKPVGYNIYFVK